VIEQEVRSHNQGDNQAPSARTKVRFFRNFDFSLQNSGRAPIRHRLDPVAPPFLRDSPAQAGILPDQGREGSSMDAAELDLSRAARLKRQEATRLLNRASEGEIAAAADLLPLVYDELCTLAESFFRNERRDHTLQPTALVHEAYARLVDQTAIEFKSRNQFFVLAAKAMRNILVDHARARNRLKRGGGGHWQEVTITQIERSIADQNEQETARSGADLERVHEALARLSALDERKAQLVELRFFAGLTLEAASDVLGIARSTASEDWRMARAWLHRELREQTHP
jgi:RNA polymerase sigma factor (TIGR02999 family)